MSHATIPVRPPHINDTDWEVFKLYLQGEKQLTVARMFRIKTHMVTKIVREISEKCKLGEYYEDNFNSWFDAETFRLKLKMKYLEATEEAVRNGSTEILIMSEV